MRDPLGWIKRLFGDGRGEVIALFTPRSAEGRSPIVRVALAGVAAIGLATAGALGAVSLAGLMLAVAFMYFISTQVLGLRIDVDPRAFYERVQREAAAYGPN